jgi:class 3 adenylate cyclase
MRERLIERELTVDVPASVAWRVLAHTERINQGVKTPAFTVTEEPQPDGSVRRRGRGRFIPPFMCEWEEEFGQWIAPRVINQRRVFSKGPVRSIEIEIALEPEGERRTRIRIVCRTAWDWWPTTIVASLGLLDNEVDKRARAAAKAAVIAARDGENWTLMPLASLSEAADRRLAEARERLEQRGYDRALIDRLIEHALGAPFDVARRIRPLALARSFERDAEIVVGLCLEANRVGLLAMGWDLLCPRCRGAKLRVDALHALPKGAHCPSCNIDYERDFARNVELSFRPERWLRELPEGEFCMQGAGSTSHVLMQRLVEPGATASVAIDLPPGHYRIRTVEPGAAIDAEIAEPAQGLPAVAASETALTAGAPQGPGRFSFHNGTPRPLHAVLEDRAWAADALTGERVIAMPIFRELCPEQVLRGGDEVEIGRVALLFSDLKGSTALYERIGDSAAYAMVREHFGLLSAAVREHGGVLVKTMGDAVMAAFHEPADAARAALDIAARIEAHNAEHPDRPISLKLGVHAGRCIAVTTAGTLDYFGGTVNLAARLEAQSRGGDIVISRELADDAGVRAILAGLPMEPGSALLRGFAEPVPFVRVRPRAGGPTTGS